MKTKRKSFTGERPIFTGSPALVQGGFNLDVVNQRFAVGDTIPGGCLSIFNETTRLVNVIKTAKVKAINADDAKIVTLETDEFYEPIFAVGDKVLVDVSGTYAAAPEIKAISKKESAYVITLSAAISGLAVGNTIVEVVNKSDNAALIGDSNSVLPHDYDVREFETPIDVVADTMQYALYERRVLPIPASQKDTTGRFLKANPHVKLTQSF